jgi:DNA-binding beta-propeller fold protein YncE
MRISTKLTLVLLLVLAACGAQGAAPRGDTSSVRPATSADLPPDAIYVRQSGNGQTALISVIDARSGAVLRALPNGVVSADRSTLYRSEFLSGGRQTRVTATDLVSGRDTRAFTIDGALRMLTNIEGPAGLTPDGRWLVLTRETIQLGDQWVSGFAVVNAVTGAVAGRVELKSTSTYGYAGVAPDGASLFLNEQGDGATRLRVWDLASAAFLPDAVIGTQWDGRQGGFTTAPLTSADARTVVWLDTGKSTPPAVRVLDLTTKHVTVIGLPDEQRSDDFEKYLLWSLALSRDGATLYAVNPALGYVDELSPRSGILNRTNRIGVTRRPDGGLAALGRLFLSVAEAKRYIRGGAVLSLDGRALFAAGTRGIAVVDTATLSSRGTWAPDTSFDSLTLSPDGGRLYAISDQLGTIRIVRTSDGTVLGEIRPVAYPGEVVRVDLTADPTAVSSLAALAPCGAYAAPDPSVSAEIQHLKTSATVLEVPSPCTVRVKIEGGIGTLAPFTGKTLTLRATSQTTFAAAGQGDLAAIGAFGLKAGDTFTLSFDSRAFPDGSYPLNFMNR